MNGGFRRLFLFLSLCCMAGPGAGGRRRPGKPAQALAAVTPGWSRACPTLSCCCVASTTTSTTATSSTRSSASDPGSRRRARGLAHRRSTDEGVSRARRRNRHRPQLPTPLHFDTGYCRRAISHQFQPDRSASEQSSICVTHISLACRVYHHFAERRRTTDRECSKPSEQ